MKKIFLFLFFPLMLSSCTTITPTPAPMKTDAPVTVEKKLSEAKTLQKKGNFQKAFMLYSEIQNEIDDVKLYREVQVLRANVLFEMRKYPAALAALAPMPELPATLNDCKKLILASRILQKMNGKPDHVEALLEVALDNSVDEPGVIPFKAAGYAELGRLYIAHKKNHRAVKCFEYATQLYEMENDTENAAVCRNIMEYLR